MHPILSQFRRLALYLLAWAPLAGLLVYLLAVPGGLSRSWSLALVVPLCLIYAFVCLSAWYSCRGTPLETSSLFRLALTHLSAAVLMSLLWLAMARALAAVLSSFDSFQGIDQHIGRQYPLLFGSGVLLYLLAVALHYVLLSSEASREAEQREMQARVLARESELRALKAQVNPHFLFNSLHSISALTSIDAARAREMCILLADFLRATLGLGEKSSIPLSEELSLARSFLAVEKVRFGARLNLEERVEPEALEFLVPPLLLQPLVENAVSHGISNLTEGGWIRLSIGGDGRGDLTIVLENSFDREMPSRRGTGMGLKNVRRRLDMRYGDRANFDVRTEGDCFRVTMNLPAEKAAAGPAEKDDAER
ncbi:MAG: histidine kinase [Acidobacteriia bacterium]|nr:histidine kinase [Terriglobia bacterium]